MESFACFFLKWKASEFKIKVNKHIDEVSSMDNKRPKKLLILYILDILQKYSDEQHRLSQKEILEILRKEYEMPVDRKAVRRNLLNLIEYGSDIEYREVSRKEIFKKKSDDEIYLEEEKESEDENVLWTDFYLKQKFSDEELRLLIDSLLFSAHIPYRQSKELIEKLESLSNVYFKSRTQYIYPLSQNRTDNKQVFYTIGILDEAIRSNKKVAFEYAEYHTDKKMYSKRRPDGSIRTYIATPYQMVAQEGKYYLICNYDKYDDISNYRIDRIRNIEMIDEDGKPFESLKWSGKQKLNLSDYMKEHVYMYSSGNSLVKFRIVKEMISDVIDLFGKDVYFSEETDTHVVVTARVNERSAEQFAKNYAPDAMVLEPERLREKLKEEMKRAWEAYEM